MEVSLSISNFNIVFKRIIFNLGLLAIIVFILDFTIGKTLKYFYFNEKSGLYYRTTISIDSTTAGVLIFGSSRANHHYIPETFEQKLKLNTYNCGREGNSILYSYAIFKAIVKRYTPQILIFDINLNDLNFDKVSYERLSSLLPYYNNHFEIRDIVKLISPFEKYKLLSKIYPYNSMLLTIVIGNMGLNKTRKGDIKGYVPLNNNIKDKVLHNISSVNSTVDTTKMNAVSEIIKYCETNNIHVIFIQSPMYGIGQSTTTTDYFTKLSQENKVIFWNFMNDSVFINKPEYFQDQDHLNNKGANYFSNLLVSKLKYLYPIQK
jgi:hypothetical protein